MPHTINDNSVLFFDAFENVDFTDLVSHYSICNL